MAEPWKTLMRVLTEAVTHVRPDASDEEEDLPDFVPDYDRVFESLTRAELYGDSSVLLEEDLLAGLFDPGAQSDHFLSFYSEEGARLAFERYGFFQLLRDKGLDPQLGADLTDPDEHKLRIWDGAAEPENLIIELGVGFRDLALPDGAECRFLFVNWLLMQNPRREFSSDRPPLPDQERPGLGLFPHFGYLLRLMAVRVKCDGLLNHPSHFYNAVLYGRLSHFVDPELEGRFRALERDLGHLDLASATYAVEEGRVRDQDGEVAQWKPLDQVAPVTNRARAWFASERYRSTVDRVRESTRFRVA